MQERLRLTRISSGLRPHRRRFDLEAAGAPHQVELELDVLRRPVGIGLRPHSDHAVAQPPLQRAEALPFQPIERIAVRVRLRDRRGGEFLAPVVVVALRAGEVELALALLKNFRPASIAARVGASSLSSIGIPRDCRAT